jgi:acyl carrier protein
VVSGGKHNIKKEYKKMVFEKIKKIISEQLEVDQSIITDGASITGDLGADSLDLVDLAMSIEDEFDIELSDDALEKIKTVSDLVAYIEDRI